MSLWVVTGCAHANYAKSREVFRMVVKAVPTTLNGAVRRAVFPLAVAGSVLRISPLPARPILHSTPSNFHEI